MSILQYHTEDSNGDNVTEFGEKYTKAREHAEEHGLRVIESTYNFDDSQMVLDCIPEPECSCCGWVPTDNKKHKIDGKLHCEECFEAAQ